MTSEPQSIIHQFLRIERRVARAVKRRVSGRSSRKGRSRRSASGDDTRSQKLNASKDSSDKTLGDWSVQSCPTYASSTTSHSRRRYFNKRSNTDASSVTSMDDFSESTATGCYHPSSISSFSALPPTAIIEEVESMCLDHGELSTNQYRTITQKDFFLECMIESKGTSVIHFFDESETSANIDEQMLSLSKRIDNTKYFRIDGKMNQFVSSKLGVYKFPTVIVLRDKLVLDRQSEFQDVTEFLEEFLEEWLRELTTKEWVK